MEESSKATDPSRVSAAGSGSDERATGLPGFTTWRSVYVFVLAIFVVCVVLFKVFELAFR